ncbi:MAG: adenylate/guanylate cyclase domain-containing protein [Bacteroidia bacterium]|nr:hypothetical protein [Bacteroidia bacterium]MDW8158339.1 adenylate/guanylate cyclase domain-containing protein [Bacteroidia bacterium]
MLYFVKLLLQRAICLILLPYTYSTAQNLPSYLLPQNFQFSGNTFVKNFSNYEYKAHPQNWGIVQDKRGLIYVANTHGLLEFDGISWRTIKNTIGKSIYSLACNNKNQIFVGCSNDLGILVVDSLGELVYQSLIHLIPHEKRNFGEVWRTHAIEEKVFFQTSQYLLIYTPNQINIIKAEKNNYFSLSYVINNTLYVSQEYGLFLWNNKTLSLIPVPHTQDLYGLEIIGLLPHSPLEFLIIMAQGEKWLIQPGKPRKRWHSEEEIIHKNIIYCHAIMLQDSSYLLGTQNGLGAFLINRRGQLLETYNKSSGLQDEQIYYLMQDILGGVWLCLNRGIARIEVTSPLTFFNDIHNLSGSIYDIAFFNGKIYIGTSTGVYFKEPSQNGTKSIFQKIGKEIIKKQSWALCNTGNYLLIGTATRVFEINNNNFLRECSQEGAFCFCNSRIQPSITFGGGPGGISVYRLSSAGWQIIKKIQIPNSSIRTLIEDEEGNLWAGCEYTGIYKISPSKNWNYFQVNKYNTKHGLPPEQEANIFWISNNILVTTPKGVFRWNKMHNKFKITLELLNDKNFERSRVFTLCQDKNESIYYSTILNNGDENIIQLRHTNSGPIIRDFLFKRAGNITVNSIRIDNSNIVWVCTADRILRYNPIVPHYFLNAPFHALVRKVLVGENQVVFHGAYSTYSKNRDSAASLQSTAYPITILPYSISNYLRFECAAPFFDGLEFLEFQYFLEGFDKHWSEWSSMPVKSYTNLPEGKYVFKVRAKNAYGFISKEASYTFYISPPWYRSLWAYLIYLLSGIGLVYGIVKWRSRSLEKQNKILEAKVSERTIELQRANEEIKTQNEKLKEANYEISRQKNISESLLLNILPQETAEELKTLGKARTKFYESVSVMFTDFKGFTLLAEKLSPEELVSEIDFYFSHFDAIIEKYKLEKIKTIGDAYMCAGGLPTPNKTHPIDITLAALEIIEFMLSQQKLKEAQNKPFWQLRLGIHTGPSVAGIVGKKKFAYDIWGDTVNLASRMEASGEVNKINISESTYALVNSFFDCQFRGYIEAKNKGKIAMYFVERIKPEFSLNQQGKIPNDLFWEKYQSLL